MCANTHTTLGTLLCSGAEMSASASAPDPAASIDLAEGWEAVTDDQGRTYWWNVDTNETTWDKPTAVVAKKGIAAGYLAATTSRLASASASEELEILRGGGANVHKLRAQLAAGITEEGGDGAKAAAKEESAAAARPADLPQRKAMSVEALKKYNQAKFGTK